MNKEKRKGAVKSIAAGLAAAAMLVTSGCGKSSSHGGPPQAQTGGKIAVITKQDLSFWDDVKKGAQDACDEFGYEMMYTVADGDNDYVSQIAAINEAINKKASAIVIAPNSETDLDEALTKALDSGIKVVTINSELNSTMQQKVSSKIGSSETDGGAVAAKNAIDAFKKKGGDLKNIGKIGIIGNTAATAEKRISGFTERMTSDIAAEYGIEVPAANPFAAMGGAQGGPPAGVQGGPPAGAQGGNAEGAPVTTAPVTTEAIIETTTTVPYEELSEYEKAKLVIAEHDKQEKEDDQRQLAVIKKNFVQTERCSKIEEAREATKKLLGTDGNGFSILFATNTNTTLGVCEALEELKLAGKITVIGYNSDEEEIGYIKRGVLDGTILQNPYIIGYVGVKYAKTAASGSGVIQSLDTGVTYVNASNMNDEFIQLLLYPDKY